MVTQTRNPRPGPKAALPFCLCLVSLLVVRPALGGQDQWTDITSALTGSVEGYDGTVPGARGIGGLAVDRHSGDLLAGLNGEPFGLYRSSDAGKTWKRIDDGNVAGGWVRSFSIQIDATRPGRIAVFRVSPPAPMKEDGRGMRARSAMTLDGGKTWQAFAKAKGLQGFGGYVHGMVDWSDEQPAHVIAQPRIRPRLAISHDGGKQFDQIKTKIAGIVEPYFNVKWIKAQDPGSYERWDEQHVLGYGIAEGAILLGDHDGMKRSSDDGATFETVSELIAAAHTPILFKGKLYWGGEKGLLVSADAGKSWSLQGGKLGMIRKGPFFGEDENHMVVVTEDGVYRTQDGAKTWKKLCDLFRDPTAWRSDVEPLWLRHDYAWDHKTNTLYVAGLAGSLWKLEVSE
jgi:photosystem II stability/assembly factor-like uncharacterized protein